MFKSLDKSPFEDSTGLKFIEYLKNKVDGDQEKLRSRKRLFRVETADTTDEFSIRKIAEKEKENKLAAEKAASPTTKIPTRGSPRSSSSTVGENRSSVFKPNYMSTPMVPTTVQTPYRASKKSVGIQNSPLVEVPLSQEPEIPETPPQVIPNGHPTDMLPPPPPTPCITEALLPSDQSLPPPPPEFLEPERIYPALDNVQKEQSALPVVASSLPPRLAPKTPMKVNLPINSPVKSPMVVIHPPIEEALASTPKMPDPPVLTPAPVSTVSLLPPEQIMAIIQDNKPETPQPPVVPQEMVKSPLAVPGIRNARTPRALVQEMPETPVTAPLTEDVPMTPARPDPEVQSPEVPQAAEAHGRTVELDDSSFFVPPTPVLKSFKLNITDCMGANKPSQTFRPPAPSRGSTSIRRGTNKKYRASEMTIPKESRRSSIVVASTQKRRLHSTLRELTPISSPQSGTPMSQTSPEKETADVHRAEPEVMERVNKDPKSAAAKKSEQSKSVAKTSSRSKKVKDNASGDGEKKQKPTRRPGPKSKVGPRPSEVEQVLADWSSEPENAPERPSTSKEPTKSVPIDDHSVFKVPAVPRAKKQRATTKPKKPVAVAEEQSTISYDPNSTRRSGRPVKPVSQILPYTMMDTTQRRSKQVSYKASLKTFITAFKEPALGTKTTDRSRRALKDVANHRLEEEEETAAGPSKARESVRGVARTSTKTTKSPVSRRKTKLTSDEMFEKLKTHEEEISEKKRSRSVTKKAARGVSSNNAENMEVDEVDHVPEERVEEKKRSRSNTKKPATSKNSQKASPADQVNLEAVAPVLVDRETSETAKKRSTRTAAKTAPKKSQKPASKNSVAADNRDSEIEVPDVVPETVNEKKRSRTTTKPATKKQKKAANEATLEAIKIQRTAAMATPEVMPPIHEDMEFEGESEPVAVPAPSKARGRSRKISQQPKISSNISNTYRENFSGNLAPASSTGVDWSTCSSMARKTRTMDLASFGEDNETRVLHQTFKGGKMLVYQDYSKGIIVLDSKKERARVKRKPLVLNMGSGSVIVNLESEHRVVRMEELDELLIPVNVWYSIENVGDNPAVLMFTWA